MFPSGILPYIHALHFTHTGQHLGVFHTVLVQQNQSFIQNRTQIQSFDNLFSYSQYPVHKRNPQHNHFFTILIEPESKLFHTPTRISHTYDCPNTTGEAIREITTALSYSRRQCHLSTEHGGRVSPHCRSGRGFTCQSNIVVGFLQRAVWKWYLECSIVDRIPVGFILFFLFLKIIEGLSPIIRTGSPRVFSTSPSTNIISI